MARSIRRFVVAGVVGFGLGLGVGTAAPAQVEPPLPPLPQVPQLAPAGHVTSPVCGDINVIAALAGVVFADLPVELVPQLLNSACQVFPPPLEPYTCTFDDSIDSELEDVPLNVDVTGWIAGALGSGLGPIGGGDALLDPLGCAPIATPTAPGLLPEAPPPTGPPAESPPPVVDLPLDSPAVSDLSAVGGDVAGTGASDVGVGSAPVPTAGGAPAGAIRPGTVGSALPASVSKPEEWTAGRYLGMVFVPLLVAGGFAASAWARRAE